MNDFNREEFKHFIESKLVTTPFRKNSILKDVLLEGISQFEISLPKFFNKSQPNTSKILKGRFGQNIIDKPISVPVNKYLLYLFGYKKCYGLNKILPVNQFTNNSINWEGLEKHNYHESEKEWV